MNIILGALLLFWAVGMTILTKGMLSPFAVPLGLYGLQLLGVVKAQ